MKTKPLSANLPLLEEIRGNDFVLTPGRYVGTAEQEDDGVPFAEKMQKSDRSFEGAICEKCGIGSGDLRRI